MNKAVIDLRSDTVTKPSPAMLEAMVRAEVGDDVLDGDPTTHLLEERTAEILGCEAALFFPSGTQANQTAIKLITRPATELIAEAHAHILHYEKTAAAAISGVQIRGVDTSDGILTADLIDDAIREPSPHLPRTSAVSIENTHNAAGGRVMPPATMAEIKKLADQRSLPLHLDGARLWNAAVSLDMEPSQLARHGTTVMVSFSKGLGCPVGSCLAGGKDLIEEAWHVRKLLGGGMRQSGFLAAACLYALDTNFAQIRDDHAHAKLFAQFFNNHPNVRVQEPETNIVMLDLAVHDSVEAVESLAQRGVLVVPFGKTRLRVVTHLNVSAKDVEWAAGIVAEVLN
ncbi:MAG: GntG family PLP-dependent aldolase [Gemmatimonadales bacterium]